MAYVLLLVGIMLTVSGVQNTHGKLFQLVKDDFTGENSFIYWAASVALVGGLGYVPALRELSRAFLVLILLVLVISNRGVFPNFMEALKQSEQAPAETPLRGSQQ